MYIADVEPYIQDIKLMVLATSENSQPWSASVFFAYDSSLNFYFLSNTQRRHSIEIMKNSKVSIAIADQKFNLGDKVKGIQIEGDCFPLDGEEAREAFDVYSRRFPKSRELLKPEMLTKPTADFPQGETVHRIWKVKPRKIKIFDEEKYGSEGKVLAL